MSKVAVIVGTGGKLIFPAEEVTELSAISTPFGNPSSPILQWRSAESELLFIARHGLESNIAPHKVNYRANLWAMHETEPDHVVAVNAVGGIAKQARPGTLAFPDQLIDYTWGRELTFTDGVREPVRHIEFTDPFSPKLREILIEKARALSLDSLDTGCYGVTQGPRLETAAEIERMEKDGCDLVGMTAMPEAALACELGLDYAICAVVVNWAAGRGDAGVGLHDEMERNLDAGMAKVRRLLTAL